MIGFYITLTALLVVWVAGWLSVYYRIVAEEGGRRSFSQGAFFFFVWLVVLIIEAHDATCPKCGPRANRKD
jgi:hypothetical protein